MLKHLATGIVCGTASALLTLGITPARAPLDLRPNLILAGVAFVLVMAVTSIASFVSAKRRTGSSSSQSQVIRALRPTRRRSTRDFAISATCLLILSCFGGYLIDRGFDRLTLAFLIVFGASYAQWLRYWWRRLKRERRQEQGLCPHCGYNLLHNQSGVCPECGLPIAAADKAND